MIRMAFIVALAKMAICTDEDVDEKYRTLPLDEFIDYFNSRNFSWKITDYSRPFYFGNLKKKALKQDGQGWIYGKCKGDILPNLPKNFDARRKWPLCETIKEINDQGTCGSCWTFGTANTASDRTCIHKGIHVHLAEQEFQCSVRRSVCNGSLTIPAFVYWNNSGLVSNKCKPYNIEELENGSCKHECVDKNLSYEEEKHFAEKVYIVCNNKEAIKTELFVNGPIQASFLIFEDFHYYWHGIYEQKFGDSKEGHSVRVIGYGEENGIEYWLVANSWGHRWGENGIVKIKMNQKLLRFEGQIIAGLPKN